MIRNELVNKLRLICSSRVAVRTSASQPPINIEKLEQESTLVDVIDEEAQQREEQLEAKRNKSRLRNADRNILLEENPYPEPASWHHGTLKYLRRTYGRYGQSSGIDPSICWPVKQELADAVEYESIKYPFTIPQMIAEAKERRKQKEEGKRARQEDIVKKMEKLEGWKQDLADRIAKKENEALVAKARKDRLIEEVKRHFGYTVDPRDERFKEMLEKKEKEQKKAMKEAKKKAKEDKMMEKLMKKKDDSKKPADVVLENKEKE